MLIARSGGWSVSAIAVATAIGVLGAHACPGAGRSAGSGGGLVGAQAAQAVSTLG